MEALTAVSVAALNVYDMVKGIDKGVVIEGVRLLEKTKGAPVAGSPALRVAVVTVSDRSARGRARGPLRARRWRRRSRPAAAEVVRRERGARRPATA